MSENQGRASGNSTPAKSPVPSSTPQNSVTSLPQVQNTAVMSQQNQSLTATHGSSSQSSHASMLVAPTTGTMSSQAQLMNPSIQQHNPSQQQAHIQGPPPTMSAHQALTIHQQHTAPQLIHPHQHQQNTQQHLAVHEPPNHSSAAHQDGQQSGPIVQHSVAQPVQHGVSGQPSGQLVQQQHQQQSAQQQHPQQVVGQAQVTGHPSNVHPSAQQGASHHSSMPPAANQQQPSVQQLTQAIPGNSQATQGTGQHLGQQSNQHAMQQQPQPGQHQMQVQQLQQPGGQPTQQLTHSVSMSQPQDATAQQQAQVQQAQHQAQQVSVMSMVAGQGVAAPGIQTPAGMVRVSLPVNIHNMQSIQSMHGMQQIQQVQGMPHIQGVQQVPQMQGIQQMQGLQQVQGLHQLQGTPSFQGLPPGVQVLQNPQFLTQQQVIPGHQAIFQNPQQFHAFSGSMVSPAINLQHMQPQAQQVTGTPKSPAAGTVLNQTSLQQAQVQQGLQIQQQQSQQQANQQQASTPSNSSGTSTPNKVTTASSRSGSTVNTGTQQPHMVQQQQLMGQKAVQLQRQGQPVVIGQIVPGVISNQANNNQSLINQQKSPIIAQANQAQVIGSPTQIRFQNQGAFVNNQGIIQPVMSMNQFQHMGMPQNISLAQPIFAASQGQQVYLRPANINQPQQTVQVQVVASKPKEGTAMQVKGAPNAKSLGTPIQGLGVIGPGARLQTLQMTPNTLRVGPALGQVTPRTKAQPVKTKTTSPRVIQPKPSVSTAQAPTSTNSQSTAPTLAVQPKIQNRTASVTRVVTATTSPRITPVETKTSVPSSPQSTDNTPTKAIEQQPSNLTLSPEKSIVTSNQLVVSGEPTKPSTVVTTVSSTTQSHHRIDQRKENLPPLIPSSAPLSSVLEPSSRPVTERKQAIVKPVLTHVIEGFVIQEATEPFPIQRSHVYESQMSKPEEEEKPALMPPVPAEEIKLECEYCKKVASAKKFKSSQRFCSKLCAKRYSVGCSKRHGGKGREDKDKSDKARKRPRTDSSGGKHWKRQDESGRSAHGMGSSSQSEDDDKHLQGFEGTSEEDSQTASTTTESSSGVVEDSPSEPRSPPELERQVAAPSGSGTNRAEGSHTRKPFTQWNVNDVASFIQSLPGCDIYVEEFTKQEIDGQALSLLKEDHLMSAMNIKLGPALKICASIKQFQEEG